MEYDKEFIDKIMFDVSKDNMTDTTYSNAAHNSSIRRILESFLQKELPPCPICGEVVNVKGGNYWDVFCSEGTAHIDMGGYDTKQEAIDAYLATPYCKMYLENKQVSKWMDEAHEYKVLCGKMAEVIRHAIRNCGCEANKGYYKEILKEYDATE